MLYYLFVDDLCYIVLLVVFEFFMLLFYMYFGGKFVFNLYGGVINQCDMYVYVKNVYCDICFGLEDCCFMLNVFVMFDDFMLDNGVIWLLFCLQIIIEQLDDEWFYVQVLWVIGKCGLLLLFDFCVWYVGGYNLMNVLCCVLIFMFMSFFFKF